MSSSPPTGSRAQMPAAPPQVVTKTRHTIIHQQNRNSGGIFPIPLLRRGSDGPASPVTPGASGGKAAVPSSPLVANRRGSMPPQALDGSGAEWDVEKGGVKMEDLRASRRGSTTRRKSNPPPEGSSAAAGSNANNNNSNNNNSRPETLPEEPHHHPEQDLHPGVPVLTPAGGPLHLDGGGGDGDVEDDDDGWDHFHPCFPHPNPHVPIDSPLAATTRIIRIPRNYMMYGDNAPAYSIIYPDLLKAYMTEEEFRQIIDTVNEMLRKAFDPWNPWNWVDAVVGVLTLWMWEEVWPTYVKRRLREVERVLEEWNERLAGDGVKVVALRRTGYINLDIQIPDPLQDGDSVIHDDNDNEHHHHDTIQHNSNNINVDKSEDEQRLVNNGGNSHGHHHIHTSAPHSPTYSHSQPTTPGIGPGGGGGGGGGGEGIPMVKITGDYA
ncbi:Golgin subfamily A member 7/ERF4 family-domain-containing protein [Peziza echinospora]|nr:Golgin subfamily A member 7/ERF4 family-domain-containing protein [Peziza echinospora]